MSGAMIGGHDRGLSLSQPQTPSLSPALRPTRHPVHRSGPQPGAMPDGAVSGEAAWTRLCHMCL